MSKVSEVVVNCSGSIIIGQAADSIHLVDDLADAFRFIDEGKSSRMLKINKVGRLERLLQP